MIQPTERDREMAEKLADKLIASDSPENDQYLIASALAQASAEQRERDAEIIKARIAKLTESHGTPEACGWHDNLAYQYDMEVVAAFNELKHIAAAIREGR